MKKISLIIGTLSLLLIFSSCTNSADNTKANAVSKDFLQKYYTVDANAEKYYKYMLSGESISDDMTSIHEKFKSDMTDTAYSKLISNRFYLRNVGCTFKKNCEFNNSNISLAFNSNDSNMVQYSFTSKITVKLNATGKQQVISESGLIQAAKQNNDWKVSYFRITSPAEFISKANLIK